MATLQLLRAGGHLGDFIAKDEEYNSEPPLKPTEFNRQEKPKQEKSENDEPPLKVPSLSRRISTNK